MTVQHIGILGGGQLAQMLALAGIPLGLECTVLDPASEPPARLAAGLVRGEYDDADALLQLARRVEALTFEFENVPAEALVRLADLGLPIRPAVLALATAQDRWLEKQHFQRLGIATAPTLPVQNLSELRQAWTQLPTPGDALLKTRRLGYDGKGQVRITQTAELESAWLRLTGQGPDVHAALAATDHAAPAAGLEPSPSATPSAPNADLTRACVLEARIGFIRELAQIVVRGADGEVRAYPPVETVHRRGVLHSARPRPNHPLAVESAALASRLAASLDYVGVLALELFETSNGLLANEFAPRVHNSGHWSIEGAVCSQFENHLRAVAGLPLGDTSLRGFSACINLIGLLPPPAPLLALPGVHLHLYHKAPRPGRKLGHVTVTADTEAELDARLDAVEDCMNLEQQAG